MPTILKAFSGPLDSESCLVNNLSAVYKVAIFYCKRPAPHYYSLSASEMTKIQGLRQSGMKSTTFS